MALAKYLAWGFPPKQSRQCPAWQPKSLKSRTPPACVVINPEEHFVRLNLQLRSGVAPVALLRSQLLLQEPAEPQRT